MEYTDFDYDSGYTDNSDYLQGRIQTIIDKAYDMYDLDGYINID